MGYGKGMRSELGVILHCTDEDRHGGPRLVVVSGIKWTILVRGRVNAGNIESWDNTEP